MVDGPNGLATGRSVVPGSVLMPGKAALVSTLVWSLRTIVLLCSTLRLGDLSIAQPILRRSKK